MYILLRVLLGCFSSALGKIRTIICKPERVVELYRDLDSGLLRFFFFVFKDRNPACLFNVD